MRSSGWIGLALVATTLSIGASVVANNAIDRRRLEVHAEAMTGGDANAGREALAPALRRMPRDPRGPRRPGQGRPVALWVCRTRLCRRPADQQS